jgi:hypothetical protein
MAYEAMFAIEGERKNCLTGQRLRATPFYGTTCLKGLRMDLYSTI